MRLCALVSGDFRRTGGMDRANFELAHHLAERVDCEVHLVSYRVEPDLAAHRNVTWHRVPKPLNSYTLAEPVQEFYGRRVARQVAARGGRVIVNGGNCRWADVNWVHAVHAAWDNSDAHAPLIFRIRNALTKRRFRRRERAALSQAKLIVTNSLRATKDVQCRVGIARTPIHTVYYGTDPQVHRPHPQHEREAARTSFGLSPDQRLIAFVGLLSRDRNKGFDVVFEAFMRLRDSGRLPLKLIAAGDGAEVPLWRRIAAERGVGDHVIMLGMTPRVPELLAAADVLVAPSRYEAYNLAVHEALCHGVPAVVSRIAGVSERYPNELSQLLIENPLDVSEVQTRLATVLDHPDRFIAETLRLSDVLRQRTWEHMARDIVQLIDST